MKKNTYNLVLLSMIFSTSLIISNVVTVKLFNTGVFLFDIPVIIPGAAVCYAITFLITDVIGEIWGKEEANKIVIFGFISQIVASLLILMTRFLPTNENAVQYAYELLLGQNWIFAIGSLVAYFSSQLWDVYIFHKLKNKYTLIHGSNKHRWIWNNASTLTSQVLDTLIFISISFGFGLGWFFDDSKIKPLLVMFLGQYIFKCIIALLDTGFFYLLTRNKETLS